MGSLTMAETRSCDIPLTESLHLNPQVPGASRIYLGDGHPDDTKGMEITAAVFRGRCLPPRRSGGSCGRAVGSDTQDSVPVVQGLEGGERDGEARRALSG